MDLATTYLGLELKHPIVASASPLAREADGIIRLAEAGAAAVVMPSVYQEEIEAEDVAMTELVEHGSLAQPEAASYFAGYATPVGALEGRIETLRKAAAAVDVPVIASINGSTPEGWVEFAHELQAAGAAAIELNLYRVPVDADVGAAEIEARWLETVRTVKDAVTIPLAVKISPWLTSPAHFATALANAGADGIVLFNRFYEPDIDLDLLQPKPDLELSTPSEIRQALMWIAMLAGRHPVSLAATTGVDGPDEVVKYLLAGADVVMTNSSLLRHGPDHVATLRAGLEAWMERRGYAGVADMRGLLAATRVADPEAYARAQYIHILTTHGR